MSVTSNRAAAADQRARVADLAAAFGVERRVIENHLALPRPRAATSTRSLSAQQARRPCRVSISVLVAAEIGLAVDRHAGAQIDAELAGGAARLRCASIAASKPA